MTRNADIVIWRWDRTWQRWSALLPDGIELRVLFHKVGGVRSKGKKLSYWTVSIGEAHGRTKYAEANAAKHAAVAEYKRWMRITDGKGKSS